MTTTTDPPALRWATGWLGATRIGIIVAIVGILMMGLTMLFGTTVQRGEFRSAADYLLTAAALPQGVGLLLFTLGFHRLQSGRDGRLGRLGLWVYGFCLTELVVQCVVSVIIGSELRWGPTYVLCALGSLLGLALLVAGSWRVGLLPRWMLGVWPPLALFGTFFGIGPIPLLLVAFLVVAGLTITRRVGVRIG